MKKTSLLFLLFSVCLSGCNESSNDEYKEDIFGITNIFLEVSENEYTFNKFIEGASSITYKDSDEKIINLNLSDFGINYDSLIGGDVLKITHNSKTEILFTDMLPSEGYIDGNISKIEVEYANIYEVILHKDGDHFSFEHVDSSIEYEIVLPQFRDGYCITRENDETTRKELETYENGTMMYYAYNPIFSNPLEYTCLYDYNPR